MVIKTDQPEFLKTPFKRGGSFVTNYGLKLIGNLVPYIFLKIQRDILHF